MSDLISHFATEVSRRLASDQDALIRRCISERLGDNWTDAEIIPRMRIEQERGKPEKMFLLDGEPLLLIWPPECTTLFGDATNQLRWSVQYQQLP